MKELIKRYWKLILAALVFIVLMILDLLNIPSTKGFNMVDIKWFDDIPTLFLGIITLCLTFSIAKNQRHIEADKIASDKFFKINFIKDYQRIKDDTLKLKIREYDDNILRNIKVVEDITARRIINRGNNLELEEEAIVMEVSREPVEIEHTDAGLDKEWKENKDAFCYARFPFVIVGDWSNFKANEKYVFDLSIVATNIFGVEVKCKLHPWFEVYKIKDDGNIIFKATHNFGNYESVKYIG